MKRFTLLIMVLMAFTLALACGGGGGGGGTGGPALTEFLGDWFGPGEDDNFVLTDIFMSINDSGTITTYEEDGDGTGLTPATFVVEDASSALISFNGGGEGGLFWDDTVTHMLLVDTWSGYVGVLEKGAAVLPSYATTDAHGSWSGYAYYFDAMGSGDWEKDSPVTLTMAADLTFTGTSPDGPFTGTIDPNVFSSSHGHYAGTVTAGGSGLITSLYLSPDKTFAAGYFLPTTADPVLDWPEEYSFLVLTKQ